MSQVSLIVKKNTALALGPIQYVHNMRQQLRGGVKGGHSAVAANYNGGQVLGEANGMTCPKGLANVGNTCYANAALQCLLSTTLTNALLDPKIVPVLRRYSSNPNLLNLATRSVDSSDQDCEIEKRKKENEKRRMQENCDWLTKELTLLTQEYTAEPNPSNSNGYSVMEWFTSQTTDDVVDPGSITKHPDRLSNCLRPYQQEDAHEFLRALVSTLVMNGRNKHMSSLFDGLLESAVTCQKCDKASLTRDRYMDLSLDINDPEIHSLDDALYGFTKTEVLAEENAVFCAKCRRKQTATKGLRLATAPSILVCHLKRFAFNEHGRLVRLHKKVDFPERLHIGEFMSTLNKATPPPYSLVGVLVHQGQTCSHGHYVAFVKKQKEWYRCNDSTVVRVDEETVMNQQAYILMYEVAEMREKTCKPKAKVTPRGTLKRQFSMPQLERTEGDMFKDDDSDHSFTPSDESTMYHLRRPPPRSDDGIFHFLTDEESGISRYLTDMMCCDGANDGFNEPKSMKLKPTSFRRGRHRRKKSRERKSREGKSKKNLSPESVPMMKIEIPIRSPRRKAGQRSQTAPRSRTNADSLSNDFAVHSPREPYSPHSEIPRPYSPARATYGGTERSRARSNLKAGDRSVLPPLPHTERRYRRRPSNVGVRAEYL